MADPLREQAKSILARYADMTLATLREDGFPQATTFSYVSDGEKIYFGCWAQSQKARNIGRDDRVSAAVHNTVRDWDKIEGVSLAARARRVEDPQELARFGQMMLKKFPQLEHYADFTGPEGAMAQMDVYRLDPVVISLLDYSKGFGHTDLVAVGAPT